MQGFFSHLKEEWFRIQHHRTFEQFHTGLTEYLRWWNSTRIQRRLGYLSPDEYLAHRLATNPAPVLGHDRVVSVASGTVPAHDDGEVVTCLDVAPARCAGRSHPNRVALRVRLVGSPSELSALRPQGL
ncbi:IS3 family transposase [Arthrobacter bambusae]|nr:hypothetical protein [Arthrobacter bambusae]MDQ0096486.1 hypothetical protein [Arthrobacter bambusae]